MRNERVDPVQEVSEGMAAQGVVIPPLSVLQAIITALLNGGMLGSVFDPAQHIDALGGIAAKFNTPLPTVIVIGNILSGK